MITDKIEYVVFYLTITFANVSIAHIKRSDKMMLMKVLFVNCFEKTHEKQLKLPPNLFIIFISKNTFAIFMSKVT